MKERSSTAKAVGQHLAYARLLLTSSKSERCIIQHTTTYTILHNINHNTSAPSISTNTSSTSTSIRRTSSRSNNRPLRTTRTRHPPPQRRRRPINHHLSACFTLHPHPIYPPLPNSPNTSKHVHPALTTRFPSRLHNLQDQEIPRPEI